MASLKSQLSIGRQFSVEDLPQAFRFLREQFPAVTKVADLLEPFAVTVKACDGKGAKIKSHTDCVMARALKRLGAHGAVISKTRSYIILDDGALAIRALTRPSVKCEMTCFDRAGRFDEGTYGLGAMNPHHRLGPNKRKKRKPVRKPGSRPPKHVGVHRTRDMRD